MFNKNILYQYYVEIYYKNLFEKIIIKINILL
jgi:hypothetical protein